jgi:peptidyl-prolyl cis-trans isomerase C
LKNISRILILLFSLSSIIAISACSGGTTLQVSTPTLENVQPTHQTGTATMSAVTTQPTPTAEQIPAAVVNGEMILLADYEAHLARYLDAQAESGVLLAGKDSELVINDLIDRLLLAQGARSEGFTADDDMVADRITRLVTQIGGQEAFNTWLDQNHYDLEGFQRDLGLEMEAAWMREQIISVVDETAEQVEAREILFFSEVDATRVWNQLEEGATFESRVQNYDPQNLGYLGWFPRGYLLEKEVEDAAFSLQPGEYSPVIETRLGFHIVQVLAYDNDRPLSVDARLTLQIQALDDWLEQKHIESQVEIFVP